MSELVNKTNEIGAIRDFVLRQPKEKQIKLLEAAYDEGFGLFWSLAHILLEAPCDKGGLPTDIIDNVFQSCLTKK